MTRNVGGADRTLRWIIGIALLALALLGDMSTGWSFVAFIIGVAGLATALLRYCPINAVFARDSRRDASALR
jgi:uncharacterized protein (DUF58 family)